MKKLFFLYISFIFFFPLEEKINAEIKNKILAKIGNNIITNYDVVNEINTILALSNQSPTKENLARLQSMAFISLKKNIIKKIEVDRYNVLDYSKTDLNNYVIVFWFVGGILSSGNFLALRVKLQTNKIHYVSQVKV